jgi:hypothetical protein
MVVSSGHDWPRWAALYAESSGVVVAVGGETVWMGWPRVQIGCI